MPAIAQQGVTSDKLLAESVVLINHRLFMRSSSKKARMHRTVAPTWRRLVTDLAALVVPLIIGTLTSFSAAAAGPRLSSADIDAVVAQYFGPDSKAITDGSAGMPRYLWGDFNGDGFADLVIPLNVDQARASLVTKKITLIPLNGATTIAEAIGQHCLGLGILQGTNRDGSNFTAAQTFFLYDCFSGYAKVGRQAPMVRQAGLHLKSDAVALDLESGAQTLIYWSGDNFKDLLLQSGD
jgi:hypothetical protein